MSSTARLQWTVFLVLIAVALVLVLWAALRGERHDWEGLVLNLGAGMIGAAVTYLLLQRLIGGTENKESWIRQLGSRVHDVAVAAGEELRRRGWLIDGSLRGANLVAAYLQGANLENADLQGANLASANLERVNLSDANLQGAYLGHASLHRADLWEANLEAADLDSANLEGAILRSARLRGARLRHANLQKAFLISADLQRTDLSGANLRLAHLATASFDENTVLPDGTHWTPDTDMRRFTDPEHPDFWRSDDLLSPAYQPREQE